MWESQQGNRIPIPIPTATLAICIINLYSVAYVRSGAPPEVGQLARVFDILVLFLTYYPRRVGREFARWGALF